MRFPGLVRLFARPPAVAEAVPAAAKTVMPPVVLRRPRDFGRWGGDPLEFRDPDAFEAGFDGQSRPFTIDLDGLPFDGMFRRGSGDTLFVFFSAAVAPRPDRVPPIFTWIGQSKRCAGSALFLADPSLVLATDLSLAWYLGTPERPLQPVLYRVVAAAARAVGAARIAFVGSSGGGFPALWLAGRFPGSAAFVNAPTTTIARHHLPRAVARFCAATMPGRRIADFPGVLELPEAPPVETGSRIVITQNAGDTPFAQHHVAPFLRSLGLEWTGRDLLADNLLLRVGEPAIWGAGHVMPPNTLTRAVLEALDKAAGPGFAGLDLPALHAQMVAAEPGPEGA